MRGNVHIFSQKTATQTKECDDSNHCMAFFIFQTRRRENACVVASFNRLKLVTTSEPPMHIVHVRKCAHIFAKNSNTNERMWQLRSPHDLSTFQTRHLCDRFPLEALMQFVLFVKRTQTAKCDSKCFDCENTPTIILCWSLRAGGNFKRSVSSPA